MLLSLTDYSAKYHPTKSTRTVRRMVKSGLLPINHIQVQGFDNPIIIQILDDDGVQLHYYPFVVDYILTKYISMQSAAKFCCENNLNMSVFCKLAKLN